MKEKFKINQFITKIKYYFKKGVVTSSYYAKFAKSAIRPIFMG